MKASSAPQNDDAGFGPNAGPKIIKVTSSVYFKHWYWLKEFKVGYMASFFVNPLGWTTLCVNLNGFA